MPYSAEISRTNPSCFLFLVDQSKSMDQVVDSTNMMTRWDAVTGAFASFVSNPATAEIPVGRFAEPHRCSGEI